MKRFVSRCVVAVSTMVVCSLSGLAHADAAHPVVALLPGVVDPFYFTMHRGAERAAKEENVELLFQVPKEWNTSEQVPILKAFIAKHPDVLLISPVDKQQLIAPLKEAADAGIKVITVDTYIGDGHYQTGKGDADFPLSYIASDNLEGGRVAARALAKAIGDKGTVYCENNKPGISSTDARAEGFMDEMKKHPNIKVLQTLYNEDDANQAAAHVAAVLARNPDLAGVFGANTFSGSGAAQGVKAAGKQGVVKVVVFDACRASTSRSRAASSISRLRSVQMKSVTTASSSPPTSSTARAFPLSRARASSSSIKTISISPTCSNTSIRTSQSSLA